MRLKVYKLTFPNLGSASGVSELGPADLELIEVLAEDPYSQTLSLTGIVPFPLIPYPFPNV